MRGRAVFLDRDGTLVEARHYPSRPADLQLFNDIGPGLAHLHEIGFKLIVFTNQGGLAHGFFDPAALDAMHAHLQAELAALGAPLAAIYHCPHDPNGTRPELAITCSCRKPQPGMLLQAAREGAIDLRRSWVVGDILHDVEAGNRAGCHTILVNNGGETEWLAGPHRAPDWTVASTAAALALIAAIERGETPASDDLCVSTPLRLQTATGEEHAISG